MRSSKILAVNIASLFIWMITLSTIYALYGHRVIQAIYEGKSIGILNSIIEGRSDYPLDVYLDTGNGMFFALIFISLLCVFLISILNFGWLKDRGKWVMGGIIVFLIVVVAHFKPYFHENELVYLINPRRLSDPTFLANDWTLQNNVYAHFVFDYLFGRLAFFLNDLHLALVGRLLAWSLLVGAFMKVAQALKLRWWEFVLGFAFWFYAGQSLAAGEWIFNGVETKCFSYVFLLMALQSILREKIVAAAVFCGLSITFHALVGGWGSLGLLIVLLFSTQKFNFNRIVLFGLLVFCFALPGLATTALDIFKHGGWTKEDYAIAVLFRASKHLDPNSFLSLNVVIEICIYYLLTLAMIPKSFNREHARVLVGFLNTLMGIFILGLVARRFQLFYFLYFYPFRLGPLFLLLFFSLSIFRFLTLNIKTSKLYIRSLYILTACFFIFGIVRYSILEIPIKQMSNFIIEWKNYLSKNDENDFSRLTTWIKTHTVKSSVFITPPWEYRFWIFAHRPQVVNYKYDPVNGTVKEWMQRLLDLNGNIPFTKEGGAGDLRKNYPSLSLEQLQRIKHKYHADYYLTVQPRQDLPFPLLYSNDSYFLYQLSDEGHLVN